MPLFEEGFRAPSIDENAFNRPHCKALSKQFWFTSHVHQMEKDRKPFWFSQETAEKFGDGIEDAAARDGFVKWAARVATGLPFLEDKGENIYNSRSVYNLSVSKCYNCDDMSVWIGQKMVYPISGSVSAPNRDMPEIVKGDYLEAAEIVDASPRGAAALLRLAIHNLCIALGESGENLNRDIGALVKRGLDVRVQRALDIVRVVGNNAVHPGELNLKDDAETARQLFTLINLIIDSMISQPNHVKKLYDSLPLGAREAVEKRDA